MFSEADITVAVIILEALFDMHGFIARITDNKYSGDTEQSPSVRHLRLWTNSLSEEYAYVGSVVESQIHMGSY